MGMVGQIGDLLPDHPAAVIDITEYGLGRVVSVESDVAVVVDFGSLQVRLTRPFDKLSTL